MHSTHLIDPLINRITRSSNGTLRERYKSLLMKSQTAMSYSYRERAT